MQTRNEMKTAAIIPRSRNTQSRRVSKIMIIKYKVQILRYARSVILRRKWTNMMTLIYVLNSGEFNIYTDSLLTLFLIYKDWKTLDFMSRSLTSINQQHRFLFSLVFVWLYHFLYQKILKVNIFLYFASWPVSPLSSLTFSPHTHTMPLLFSPPNWLLFCFCLENGMCPMNINKMWHIKLQ